MKSASLIAAVLVLAAIGLTAAILRRPAADLPNAAPRPARIEPTVVSRNDLAAAPSDRRPTPKLAAAEAMFRSSKDYLELARTLHVRAVSGDPDAQFFLSKALEYCTKEFQFFFRRRGQPLSLSEGLQYAARRRLSIEHAQVVFDRCRNFTDAGSEALGTSDRWLVKAAESGQPIAEATLATKLLMRDHMRDAEKSGAVKQGYFVGLQDIALDPRSLFRSALKSGVPDVLFSLGEAQGLLSPAADTSVTRYAWWLIACQQGLDCAASAEWVQISCAGDPRCASAISPEDLVRILADDQWPEVQQRAELIRSALSAGQWQTLVPDRDSAPAPAP